MLNVRGRVALRRRLRQVYCTVTIISFVFVTEAQRKTVVRHHSVGFRFGIPAWVQHRRGERPPSGKSTTRSTMFVRFVFVVAGG